MGILQFSLHKTNIITYIRDVPAVISQKTSKGSDSKGLIV